MMLFNPGKIVTTYNINVRMKNEPRFAAEINNALERFLEGDWGDLDEENKMMNDEALESECEKGFSDSIFAMYRILGSEVYIITECDRSVTTILYAEEY